jgi:hypothetical protein
MHATGMTIRTSIPIVTWIIQQANEGCDVGLHIEPPLKLSIPEAEPPSAQCAFELNAIADIARTLRSAIMLAVVA